MNHEQIQYVPLDKIDFAPQVRERMDEESLAELAQSIREVGLLQTPRVRKEGDRFVAVVGERRLRAEKLNGSRVIGVVIEDKVSLSRGEILQRQLAENSQRLPFRPVEEARGIKDFMDEASLSASEVAAKLGKSNAAISRALALLELPEEIKAQVESGKIAASAAYKLSHVRDAGQQSELAGELAAGRLTRDGLNGAIKPKRRNGARPSQRQTERVTAALGGGRSISVSGPGLTVDSLIAWLEEFLSRARDIATQASDLPSLAKLLKANEVAR